MAAREIQQFSHQVCGKDGASGVAWTIDNQQAGTRRD